MTPKEFSNIFDRYISEPPEPTFSKIISFDEKYLNKEIAENGYSFIIVDWINIKILKALDSRHKVKLASYFSKIPIENRNNVQYITMDMYETYKDLAKIYFKNAKIAIDSFHVLQNLYRALDSVRTYYLRKYDNGSDDIENNDIKYYLLKKGKDSFYKINGLLNVEKSYNKKFRYYMSERDLVNSILQINPEIKEAYNLTQMYLEFNYKTPYKEAKSSIDEIIKCFLNSKIKVFRDFGWTISTWKEYILNSFITIYDHNKKKYRRLSDGPIEGLNNSIEKIHKNGNGYTSFKRFYKVIYYKINKSLYYKI